MVASRFRVLLSLIPILIITTNITQALDDTTSEDHCCFDENGSYSTSSTYYTNLNYVLSSLPSSNHGRCALFYSSSYGENTDKVYATGLCRGDLKHGACKTCLTDSTKLLRESCPNQKEAIGWYENCTIRYSYHSILGIVEELPAALASNQDNVSSSPSEVDLFNQRLMKLLRILKDKAAKGGSIHKFSIGNATASDSNRSTIYALVQCTPDLSELGCSNCLEDAIANIQKCCYGRGAAKYVSPSCNLRYEDYVFFDYLAAVALVSTPPSTNVPIRSSTTRSPPSAKTTISAGKKSKTSRTFLINVLYHLVAIVVFMVLIMSICIYLRTRKTKETLVEGKKTNTSQTFVISVLLPIVVLLVLIISILIYLNK